MRLLHALCVVYLVAVMFSLGLELTGEDKAAKRQKRRHLLSGLLFNIVLIPVIALAVTRVIGISDDITSALLLLAAAPGGRYIPHLDRFARGDRPLAIELTLFLAKLTPFTAPITAAWLLGLERVDIRELPLIAQLVILQWLPLEAGRAVRRRWPGLAGRMVRPLRLSVDTWAALLFVVIAVFSGTHAATLAGDRGWAAVLAVILIGGAAGWLVGGPQQRTRRTFALSANARNLALVFIIADEIFPQSNLVRLAALIIWTACLLFNIVFALLVARGQPAVAGRQPRTA
jgi:BASS family bile acid:Na+ symporter